MREIEFSGTGADNSEMHISVIICTFNRCETLVSVLENIAHQVMPETVHWEVLVVDNNSTDKTREVIESAASKWPNRFRYIFEQQQGLSRARNRGVSEARGAVIAFTDDDVKINPDWLCNLTSCLHAGDLAGAGGKIIPVWAKPLPDWMSLEDDLTLGVFVQFDAGTEPGALDRPPYGANMAFHRRTFEKYGGFRADLGRSGKNLLSSEDTEFGNRLLAAGERMRYEPNAVVFHPAPESRMTRKFVLRWWFWFGYGEVVRLGPPSDGRWMLGGIPLNYLRRIVRWSLQSIITINPPRRFAHLRTVCYLAGTVVGWRQHSKLKSPREEETKEVLHVTSKSASLETRSPR